MQGYDLEVLQAITRTVNIPVIASGGAGKVDDFRQAIRAGASAVAAGSMFVFHGRHRAVLINYPNRAEMRQALS
jgi:cyclase